MQFIRKRPRGSDDHRPQFADLYELFGVTFRSGGGNELLAEACPFCRKDKFYLNPETGLYKCHSANTCGESGNVYTFITRAYREAFDATTDEDYHPLRDKRRIPLQTLKRHGLALHAGLDEWLVPYLSEQGVVQNLTRYNLTTGAKHSLPRLPLRLHGLDKLSSDRSRPLLVCEGAFDGIALDHHLRETKTRTRYDILSVPSATTFKPEWVEFLKGRREVRLCYDNDKAGKDGMERVAKFCRERKAEVKLSALRWPDGYADEYDLGDLIRDGVNVAGFTRERCAPVVTAERRITFARGCDISGEKVTWLYPGHIPFGTFVSLSGLMGTHKSSIVRDIAARATAGLSMPNIATALPPFDVMYFTSEDAASRVVDSVRVHGGDLSRLHVHDVASGSEVVDLLDCLGEMEAAINEHKVRLVILDALNSFVGGEISTDSKARRTLSGRLQSLARRMGACVIGVRNWGRVDSGSASQRSLGATSLSDVARCVMNTQELRPDPKNKSGPRRFLLEFEKVSDAPKPKPVAYTVENLSTCDADSHLRRIVWKKEFDPVAFKASLKASLDKGQEKG